MGDGIDTVYQKNRALEARVEELEKILWVKYDTEKPLADRYIFTTEQIDAMVDQANAYTSEESRLAAWEILNRGGIVRCEGCGGKGLVRVDGVREQCSDCNGHRWRKE